MRAQLSWEFVATVFLFIISTVYFLFLIFQISPFVRYEIEAESKKTMAFKISEILVSDTGDPPDWEKEYFGPSLETHRLYISFSGFGLFGVPKYSLLLSIDTESLISAGNMNEDCSDIRFTDTSFNFIPYYLEQATCNSEDTKIWIRVNLPSQFKNETVYMYYSKSSLESRSNIKEVFDFYDDFSDSDYTNEEWDFEKNI